MISLIFLTTLTYILGSISGSMVMGKFKNVDIRKMGSGNAGGTNAFRTQGILFALPVVLIDIGKGFIAAEYFHSLNFLNTTAFIDSSHLIFGSAAVIGHCYPIFHNFKGGKGVATYLGILFALSISLSILFIFTWLVVTLIFKYSSLSSIFSSLTTLMVTLFKDNFIMAIDPNLIPDNDIKLILFVFFILIIFTHRKNISNLRNNIEKKIKI